MRDQAQNYAFGPCGSYLPSKHRPVPAEGRPVVWIEDFNGDFPDVDGVVFIDTGQWGVLRWTDLEVDTLMSPR